MSIEKVILEQYIKDNPQIKKAIENKILTAIENIDIKSLTKTIANDIVEASEFTEAIEVAVYKSQSTIIKNLSTKLNKVFDDG
jgi:hypothetical protein